MGILYDKRALRVCGRKKLLYPARQSRWVRCYQNDFEDGGADASQYSTGNVPNGFSYQADWTPAQVRVRNPSYSAKGIRFYTTGEAGGSSNSLFTVSLMTGNLMYAKMLGMTRRYRMNFWIYIPTGGCMYRTSAHTYWWACRIFYLHDANKTFSVNFNTQSQLGIVCASGLSTQTTAPSATLDITGYNSTGWHNIDIEFNHTSTGYCRVIWDGALTATYCGDFRCADTASGGNVYWIISGPGGYTASNSDLQYFGGLDEVQLYRRAW